MRENSALSVEKKIEDGAPVCLILSFYTERKEMRERREKEREKHTHEKDKDGISSPPPPLAPSQAEVESTYSKFYN